MTGQSESGNVILMVLIGIGLLAALIFAFSSSNRSSSSLLTQQQADAYAGQILSLGNDIKQAVKRIKLAGCADTQLSFEGADETGIPGVYTNATSPSDQHCHVFSGSGGGLSYTAPDQSALDSQWSAEDPYGKIIFVFNNGFAGVPNGYVFPIHAFVPFVSDTVCRSINQTLHGQNAIPENTNPAIGLNYFNGTLALGGYITCEVTPYSSTLCNQNEETAGCLKTDINWGTGSGIINIAYVGLSYRQE